MPPNRVSSGKWRRRRVPIGIPLGVAGGVGYLLDIHEGHTAVYPAVVSLVGRDSRFVDYRVGDVGV